MPVKALSEELMDPKVFADFTLEESRAFVDLTVLVMMIDERISDVELEELSAQLTGLPFDSEEDIERHLADHIAYSRQTIEQVLGDDAAIDEFIAQTTAKIEEGTHRRHTLELLAAMAYSDAVDPAEEDICHRVGRAFGFDDQAVDAVLGGGSAG